MKFEQISFGRPNMRGCLTSDIEERASSVLLELSHHADAVVLTCSTLGPAVVAAGRIASVPILRVDGALAEKAVKSGGKIVVLCAVETTLLPTEHIFAQAARGTSVAVEVRLVPHAWALFKAGDREGYLSAIAMASHAAYDDGASMVALAQASMAGAAELVRNAPEPISSPTAGLARALEHLTPYS
ncbi:aspartate/glutamate racemase family protein [Ensifer sp. LCM 4579]|uniref:aspartate/glutamate racemase family protein n=1 Tax=Ensifer sp. LCM 4579 TaxID=1848292 RepID=UPI001FCDCFB6|nr:aspartate/glutamate racemase family protein [Ensifer sp. LCM 4579]